MNRSIKAVLLSALVYPGVGHFYLKKYVAGVVLVSVFSIPLFLVIGEIVNKTNRIIERIENGDIPLDIMAISEAMSNVTSGSEAQELNIKIYIMIVVWVIAALDAYRLGKTNNE